MTMNEAIRKAGDEAIGMDGCVNDVWLDPAAFRRALAEQGMVVEQGWQPIETAPKMKTILLFAVTDIGEGGTVKNWKMATGFWHSGFVDHRDMSPWQWDGRQLAKYDIQPTHWRALPDAPVIAAAENGK
jgi:hypothetical protein